MLRRLFLSLTLAAALPLPGVAEDLDTVVTSQVLPGWRNAQDVHTAAVHLRLAPGWKTYWRAPGDAGIPPQFVWHEARNVAGISIEWPTPGVFWQDGTRSIGYHDEVIVPIRLHPETPGADMSVSGEIQIGVCDDICLPFTVTFQSTLPASQTRRDPVITAALINRPFTRTEAGVTTATCTITPVDGGLALTARITMPSAGGQEEIAIETTDPLLWVSKPDTRRDAGALTTTAQILHVEGKSFALDRASLRFTVIGQNYAVDIPGCTAP